MATHTPVSKRDRQTPLVKYARLQVASLWGGWLLRREGSNASPTIVDHPQKDCVCGFTGIFMRER